MSYINETYIMDEIFSLEQKAEQLYRRPIFNVSHWNSSVDFQSHMMKTLVLPPQSLPWDYYYTYSVSELNKQQIMKRLGVLSCESSTMGLLLQSSTIAILNIINLLVQFKYKRLCILQPSYFSVASCCSVLSLEYDTEPIYFINNYPCIPIDTIISKGYDCIWITSPIFCTGYYYNNKCIDDILYLKSKGMTIIFDESLALPGKELLRHFTIDKSIFAIYSPHKAISMNGLKFSIIVCDNMYEDFLEQWVDVFSGALSCSNRDAIFHYLSPNYLNACYPAYQTYINQNKTHINSVLANFPFASVLPNTEGHYINIFTDIYVDEKNILNFTKDIIYNCLTSFIPSILNGFNASQNFSFRVNLTANTHELTESVTKILHFIGTNYH